MFMVYLVLDKVFSSLWCNLYALGQIFIAENGQILNTQSGRLVTLGLCYCVLPSSSERAIRKGYLDYLRKCQFDKHYHHFSAESKGWKSEKARIEAPLAGACAVTYNGKVYLTGMASICTTKM